MDKLDVTSVNYLPTTDEVTRFPSCNWLPTIDMIWCQVSIIAFKHLRVRIFNVFGEQWRLGAG